jgi:hypothetical protein
MTMLLNFDRWTSLFESNKYEDDIEKVTKGMKDTLGKIHAVPNFQEIRKPGEPVQQRVLYSNDDINDFVSFAINYTKMGELYSVDFWSKDNNPVVTLKANGMDIDQILPFIKEIASNPSPNINIKKLNATINPVTEKFSNEVKLPKVEKPKPVTDINPHVDALERGIEKYKFQDPNTIFDDLRRYVDMVRKGIQPSLIITGMPGVGKSFIVAEQLHKAGMKKDEDFVMVEGKSTPAGMYIALYQNIDKLIVFDDCDSIWRDENAVNILKRALGDTGGGEIAWLTSKPLKMPTGGVAPQKFKFNGRIIFISNLAQKTIADAIKSRAFVLEVALSPEDMVKYMEDMIGKVMPEENISVKKFALKAIKVVAKKNPSVQLNMRTLVKAIKIIKNVDDLEIANRMIVQQCSYE